FAWILSQTGRRETVWGTLVFLGIVMLSQGIIILKLTLLSKRPDLAPGRVRSPAHHRTACLSSANPTTMKAHRHLFTLLAGAAAVAGLAGWLRAADLKIRPLTLDLEGRFWVYRNGPAQPLMPYSPYAWMSDSTNLSSLIHMDLEC